MSGSGGGGGSDFGGGGSGLPAFDCSRVSITTNIISPNVAVLAALKVGDVLQITLHTATGPLIATAPGGGILGAVFTKDPTALINCINGGYTYKAKILKIASGDVQILISNR